MIDAAADLNPRKTHNQENFPVASFVIRPRHRAVIMAFYRFARTADDIADHPSLAAPAKLAALERMRASLTGEDDGDAAAVGLRQALAARAMDAAHGLDLLTAFRRDVVKTRYAGWAELIDYCRYSAMPVGRFVLDVHGEDRAIWPLSDALCAALQVINHLQDCGKDYRELDRCYLSQEALAGAGASTQALSAARASPALRSVIVGMAQRTRELLRQARPFAGRIVDHRLAYEVALIQRLAEDLTGRLIARDPLSERVRHRPLEVLGLAIRAGVDQIGARRRAAAEIALAEGAR
jgi:squalene synthase HpnC